MLLEAIHELELEIGPKCILTQIYYVDSRKGCMIAYYNSEPDNVVTYVPNSETLHIYG